MAPMLRYPIDLLTLIWMGVLGGMVVYPFFIEWGWGFAFFWLGLTLLFKNAALGAQHNHAHLPMFRYKMLNDFYDIYLAQITGYTTPEWSLQHALGHHQTYLNPQEDITSPVHSETGAVLGLWTFTWRGFALGFGEALNVAKRLRNQGKQDLPDHFMHHILIQGVLTLLALGWQPLTALVFLVFSNMASRALLWWGTYWQHVKAPATHLYDASNTTTHPWLNALVFNTGYHTAHHEKPGLHWSQLPLRTREILHRIPDQCVRADINFHLNP